MILFDNWTIQMLSETEPLAQQYDDGSRRVDVEGDLPEGYTWQLLVQCGGNADTILLTPTQTGVGAVLGADNLSQAGNYDLQLRGTLVADGTTKRHTNVVSSFVPESLTGLGTWPEVPTEFAQTEAHILELYRHPPIPGSNGCWLVWDEGQGEYAESQLALPDVSIGPPGPAGFSPTVRLTENAEGVRIDVTDQEGTKSASVLHGENGQPGVDGVSPTVTVARNEADTGAVITAANADGTTTSVEVLDGADGDTYTLPIASSSQLGGVQPAEKTDAMTQEVGVDEAGGLWTAPGGGDGESVGSELFSLETTEEVAAISATISANKRVFLNLHVPICTTNGTLRVVYNDKYDINCTTGNKPSTNDESNYFYYAEKIADEGYWRILYTAYKSTVAPNGAVGYSAPFNMGEKITNFNVNMWQANFPVGTKVTVWGV